MFAFNALDFNSKRYRNVIHVTGIVPRLRETPLCFSLLSHFFTEFNTTELIL